MDISTAPIRTMEAAITARLRLAFPVKTFAIERVPLVLTIKEFERIARAVPYIGLAWGGFRPDGQTNARLTKGEMRWRVILVYRASNSLEARFKGDARGIGLDAMTDVAMLLLNGAVFEDIGTSHVTGSASVFADGWSDDQLVISQVDFSVAFQSSSAALKLTTAADFERMGITWSVAPEDEDAPAVTDTLTLPT